MQTSRDTQTGNRIYANRHIYNAMNHHVRRPAQRARLLFTRSNIHATERRQYIHAYIPTVPLLDAAVKNIKIIQNVYGKINRHVQILTRNEKRLRINWTAVVTKATRRASTTGMHISTSAPHTYKQGETQEQCVVEPKQWERLGAAVVRTCWWLLWHRWRSCRGYYL